jgi:hypothetical protein
MEPPPSWTPRGLGRDPRVALDKPDMKTSLQDPCLPASAATAELQKVLGVVPSSVPSPQPQTPMETTE